MKRWLIAHDENGYHVRETLCVNHDFNKKEAIYHTKPKGSSNSFIGALRIARKLEKRSR